MFKTNAVKYPLGVVSIFGNLSFTKTFNNAFCCYLGIQDVYGKYLINVPHAYSKTIKYAGAKIIYKHQSMKYKDVLEIRGPTNEALKVVVGFKNIIVVVRHDNNTQ